MQQIPQQPSISIADKVILITGAYGLIGFTIAQAFLLQGARVVLADINDGRKANILEALEREFPADSFLLATLDITREESCEKVISEIAGKFGKLDVLVNNAAIDAKFDQQHAGSVNPSRFEYYPVELLRKSVEVNLTGTVIITQFACRQMLKQGSGNIINVASTYSMVAPNQSLYDFGEGVKQFKPVDYIASKSFIPNFTRYIATFYSREGIRCNAIVPHAVFNNHNEAFLKNFAKLSPLGRMCDREELVGPFTFLASDASSYMTGSVLTVDGGWTAW
ncbi:Dihydroanticapsin 7-dehydrogenase [Dyadobacter sp. CECT 9275]|uniref:Dihydroanticapsin 7-dehydrogenase n=1 Tax=Dyadobacter helix TaxID=2822344 RepID=A0A916JER1_9BACT|nr:SDR family oxidoreductase [Dyadobacter sp. CECT 9275]CAG5007947.1 Dihydroanticapsin 7-dehydrogenase [Dyadobacter sp. CECT 9275]